MRLNIINIINNKLHTLKYINYTIIFYIIFFYTCYNLFIYLRNKNYIMLLLYFVFFIVLYSYYKNFTFVMGFVFLIILKIFNIDNIIKNGRVIEGNDFSSVLAGIEDESQKKGDKMEEDSKKTKPPSNPCKSYIIDKVQQAGFKISNSSFNSQNKKSSAESDIDDILRGHDDLVAPKIYRL